MTHTDPRHADALRDLATAALKFAALATETLPAEAADQLQAALAGGARVFVEFGPVPNFSGARVTLVEAEGRRHLVAEMRLAARRALEPLQ